MLFNEKTANGALESCPFGRAAKSHRRSNIGSDADAQMASQSNTSDQQVVIGISSGLLFLTTFVVYLRLYIRYILKPGSAGWDDVVVSVAWVSLKPGTCAQYKCCRIH